MKSRRADLKNPRYLDLIREGRIDPGMSFQEKVWALTSRIPRGGVATYADVAHALDSRGYRAVGTALHNNPYAPKVPCHRVVASDGSLCGFAGGLKRKRELLDGEGVGFRGDRVDLARHRVDLARRRADSGRQRTGVGG